MLLNKNDQLNILKDNHKLFSGANLGTNSRLAESELIKYAEKSYDIIHQDYEDFIQKAGNREYLTNYCKSKQSNITQCKNTKQTEKKMEIE